MEAKYSCPNCSQHVVINNPQPGALAACPNCGVGFKLNVPPSLLKSLASVRIWIIAAILAACITGPMVAPIFKSAPKARMIPAKNGGPAIWTFEGRALAEWAGDVSGSDTVAAARARKILMANGNQVRPALAAQLRDESAPDVVRTRAASALGWITRASDPEVGSLFDSLRDPKRLIRENALESLRRLRIPASEAIPLLVSIAENPNRGVRHNAAQFIGDFARTSPEAVEALKKLANDPDPVVRLSVKNSLAKLAPPTLGLTDERMNAAILELIDRDPEVRKRGRDVFRKIGHDSVPELIAALENKQLGVRERALAAQILGDAGQNQEPEVPALLHGVHDREASVREYSALALAQVDRQHSFTVPLFINLLSDGDATIRRRSAEHLASISAYAGAAIPRLQVMVEKEPDSRARNAAKAALMKIQNNPASAQK